MQNRETPAKNRPDGPLFMTPAMPVFFGWCAVIVLTHETQAPAWLVISVSLLLGTGLILIGTTSSSPRALPVAAVVLTVFICGSLRLHAGISAAAEIPPHVKEQGTVVSIRDWGYRSAVVVNSRAGRFVLYLAEDAGVEPGERIAFSGAAVPFAAAVDGGFDERLFWKGKGALCALYDPAVKRLGFSGGIHAWRHRLSRRIGQTLPPRTAGYLLASWTGARDPMLESQHRSVGTSHLLAVSGFHVGIVACIFIRLLRRMPYRSLACGPLVWLYVGLTGSSPGAVRAALMLQILLLGSVVGRARAAFNSIAAAGCVMLAMNPWIFWDIGWRLSMLAILTITATAALELPPAAKALLSSPLAWLGTFLQTAGTFGPAPLAGIFANYVAIPVFAFLLPAASALSLPALAGLPGGTAVAGVPEFLFERWETLAGNILFLCPWKVSQSPAMTAACTAASSYLFCRASGFSRNRACLTLAPVLAVMYLTVLM